ncbi:MAG: Ku protein, partial [Rubrivivax sp.]
ELGLALQLIDQISQESYDPGAFQDEEKKRILAAIDEKISGKEVVASAHDEEPSSAQVIDLMEALRASLGKKAAAAKPAVVVEPVAAKAAKAAEGAKERKGAKRASPKVETPVAAPAARARARK